MIIVCPECSSRYMLSASAIGETGRTVRCANCKHQWHQEPQRRDESRVKAPDVFDKNFVKPDDNFDDDFSDHFDDVEDESLDIPDIGYEGEKSKETDQKAPEAQSEPEDDLKRYIPEQEIPDSVKPLAEGANLPAFRDPNVKSASGRGGRIAARLLAVFIVMGLCLYAIAFKERVLAVFPPASAIYSLIGQDIGVMGEGLIIEKASATIETIKNEDVLVIKGVVLNLQSTRAGVPNIIATLRDEEGADIQTVTIIPRVTLLNPEGRFEFKSEVAAPPSKATSVNLTFEMTLDF